MAGGAFVGREPELRQLRTVYSRARGGQGSVVVVSGEPGIGKTRLAREFVQESVASGALSGWGRCYEGPWSAPFTPWSEALSALLTDRIGGGASAAHPLTTLIAELAPGTDQSNLIPLTADQERFRLFDSATRTLVEESAHQPVVVVIDDIQWADQASLDLVQHVAYFVSRSPIVLIVLERTGETERSGHVSETIESLRLDTGALILPLGGLSVSAVTELVGEGSPFSQQLSQSLAAQTSGNPFFINELIRHLVDEVDATPRISPTDLSIPEGVRVVVERRLRRLTETTQATLHQAAVFTNGFDFRVLQHLADVPEETLLDALDEALAAHLVESVPGRLERYDFVHAIVRQSLAESWNPSRRVRLHRRAAEALESVYGERTEEVAAELAVQYHRSRSLPGALTGLAFARLAVEQARRNFAPDQAVTFLGIARDLASEADPDERARICGQFAVAEAEIVRIENALARADEYLELATAAELPGPEIAEVMASLARALKYSAYADERQWRPIVEQGLRRTKPEDGTVWARLCLLLDPIDPLSRSGVRVGRWLGFDPKVTAILSASPDDDDVARSVESFDAVSRTETDRYLTRVRSWSSPTAVMYGLTVAANHLQYRHGAFRDARLLWQELVELSSRAGAIHWQQQATNQLTYLLIAEGAFAEASDLEQQSNELATRLGPGQNPAGHQLEMETCRAVYQGADWAKIGSAWQAMLDDPALGPHDLSTLTGAYYGGLAAYCLAQTDDRTGAVRLLEMLTPILQKMNPRDCNHNGAIAFAVGAVFKLRAAALAPTYLKLVTELIDSGIGDYPQTSLRLSLGQLLTMENRKAEALAAFSDARVQVGRNGQAPMLPIIDCIEAECLVHLGDATDYGRVQELIASARSRFTELAMEPWLEHANLVTEVAHARIGGPQALPAGITEREADVLRLITRGYSDRQVSDELFVSPRTVNAHVRNMLSKTGSTNRVELAMWARTNAIVDA